MSKIKTIAMYLPQFHQVAENDEWWGQGFTEWQAVRKAVPLYAGHDQPRVPLENRYYNLLDKDTMKWQAELAKQYLIEGFCFYHYWFENGRKILEKPAENLLQWKDINMPFCFSWANESWIRTWEKMKEGNAWAGKFDDIAKKSDNSGGILINQDYGDEKDWKVHFEYLLPFFEDERYIRIADKPVFIIYKPEDLKEKLNPMLECWKRWAVQAGLSGLYIIGAQCAVNSETRWPLMDARIKHGPAISLANEKKVGNTHFFDYDYIWKRFLGLEGNYKEKTYYCGFVDFDSSPRQGDYAIIFEGASPTKFEKYFDQLLKKSIALGNELVFLNAWNEWGEGMYLEPDTRFGFSYLEAVKSIMQKYKEIEVKNEPVQQRAVDIIVPIYNAYDEVRKCVESIKRHTDLDIHRLLLLNDNSTDERMLPYLLGEETESIIVFNNKENLGFSANINQGIVFSNRDVILLNSDTIVTEHWVDKMTECAYREESIATVTPLSNNATIFSVPGYGKENKLPRGFSIDRFAQLVEDCSMKKYMTVPTAHGFCMYIKREVIDKIGILDEVGFERGYGEENDFCYRAGQIGYHDVMCDDTFIYHSGTSSFLSNEKAAYIQKHVELIKERHGIQFNVTDLYCAHDPNWEVHENIELQIELEREERINILYMLQSDFKEGATDSVGGVQLHVKDLVEVLKFKNNIIVVARDGEFLNVTVYINEKCYPYQIYIGKAANFPEIRSRKFFDIYKMILKTFRIQQIHVHHTLGLSLEIFYAAKDLGIPIDVTLHDYYYMCPNVKMLDYDEKVCINGEELERCKECLRQTYNIFEMTDYLNLWRKETLQALQICESLIVPSMSAQKIVEQYFSTLKERIILIEHGSDVKTVEMGINAVKKDKKFHVAFVGGLNVAKGARNAYEMIFNGSKDINWYIFGNLGYSPLDELSQTNLTKYGQYNRDELPQLIAKEEIDLVCILPIWQETFCYTLSEALLSKVPVLVTDSGAVGERVRAMQCGWTVPFNSDYREILNMIDYIRNNKDEYINIKNNVLALKLKNVQDMCTEYQKLYSSSYIKKKPQCSTQNIREFYDIQKETRRVQKAIGTEKEKVQFKILEKENELQTKDNLIQEKVNVIQSQEATILNQGQTIQLQQNEIQRLSARSEKFVDYFNILQEWMAIKENGAGLDPYFLKHHYEKIAIYGWGVLGKLLYKDLRDTEVKVEYAIDRAAVANDINLAVMTLDDAFPEVDVIVVTATFAFEEIRKDLEQHTEIPIISLRDVVFEV